MAAALRSQLDLAATTTPVDMALSRAATLRREALRVSLTRYRIYIYMKSSLPRI